MSTLTTAVQTISISTALIGSGGIASLSLFDAPLLKSQPASRSLPSVRWLFSRGSHTAPPTFMISSAGFAYLAAEAFMRGRFTFSDVSNLSKGTGPIVGYAAAAVLALGVPAITAMMIPTNFRLIELNEKKGGARSEASAEAKEKHGGQAMSAEESVNGKGQKPQFTDLSGPQDETEEKTSSEEDEEVEELLGKFATLNMGRAVALGASGVVALVTALVA